MLKELIDDGSFCPRSFDNSSLIFEVDVVRGKEMPTGASAKLVKRTSPNQSSLGTPIVNTSVCSPASSLAISKLSPYWLRVTDSVPTINASIALFDEDGLERSRS